MPWATDLSIAECNQGSIGVLLDACVLLPAIKHPDSLQRSLVLSIDARLRYVASVTLFEIAFARSSGRAPTTLKQNQQWLREHYIRRLNMIEGVGRSFDTRIDNKAARLRGNVN